MAWRAALRAAWSPARLLGGAAAASAATAGAAYAYQAREDTRHDAQPAPSDLAAAAEAAAGALLPALARAALAEQDREKPLVFSGTANPALSQEVARELGVDLGGVKITAYADGEKAVQILTSVRNKHVFVIQPTCRPVNDSLMELFLICSTMKRASAKSITAVIPYYGYARQDRKTKPRVPISAADVAHLLESSGVDRVLSIDLHCGQIQGFFRPSTPVDNLYGATVAYPYFKAKVDKGQLRKVCVVSPDAGGVTRAKKFRDGLRALGVEATFAMIIKERLEANKVAGMDLVGSVEDADVIIVDDMIDTAGTLCKAAGELKSKGANKVVAFASHAVFSGEATTRIQNSVMDEVVVLNTIPLDQEKLAKSPKVTQLSVGKLLGDAVSRISRDESLSELF